MRTISIGRAMQEARARLEACSDTSALDALVLLSHILNQDKSWILAHPERSLSSEQDTVLQNYLAQLEKGVPLPYILGDWEFFGIKFKVNPNVLIPRPETELLVESALSWLEKHPSRHRVLDAGTGSGCIAISIAKNHSTANITALDISKSALGVAKKNAELHSVDHKIQFLTSDLLDKTHRSFDLIVSNPPYIPTSILQKLKVAKNEPQIALDGGPDGLSIIRRLVAQSSGKISKGCEQTPKLALGGCLMFEIEATIGTAAVALAKDHYPEAKITIQKDLAGLDRFIIVEYN